MAIEQGVRRGWQRAHKHVDDPTELSICDRIEQCVMEQIHEYFTFEEVEGEYSTIFFEDIVEND